MEARRHGKSIAANQVLYSLLDYNSKSLRETEKVCKENNITMVGYSPVGQGLLVDALTEDKFKSIRMAQMTGLKWLDAGLLNLRDGIADISIRHRRPMAQVKSQLAVAFPFALQLWTGDWTFQRIGFDRQKSYASRGLVRTVESDR